MGCVAWSSVRPEIARVKVSRGMGVKTRWASARGSRQLLPPTCHAPRVRRLLLGVPLSPSYEDRQKATGRDGLRGIFRLSAIDRQKRNRDGLRRRDDAVVEQTTPWPMLDSALGERTSLRTTLTGTVLLFTMAASLTVGQNPTRVVVTRWAHVFVTPHVRQEALAQVEAGVELSVLRTEGEWYLVEYESRRWGQRRGYIHRTDVRPVSVKAGTTSQISARKDADSSTAPRAVAPTVMPPASPLVPAPDRSSVDLKLLVLESFLRTMAAGPVTPTTSRKIMIFGGRGHHTYLGCLSCPASAPDSILNEHGKYGDCQSAFADNLFCRGPFKEFGSSGPFHDQSACANGASDPPVIVDGDGNYYGRFSVGGPFGHRDAVCGALGKFKNQGTCETVEWVCQH
jgi:hypothetical protein